jgi:hypothetical protein
VTRLYSNDTKRRISMRKVHMFLVAAGGLAGALVYIAVILWAGSPHITTVASAVEGLL